MKVREIPEYREFVDTQIIPLNARPDVRGVYVALTRQSESHRRLAKHKPEGIVNAAYTIECFNCVTTTISKQNVHIQKLSA
jgi:hypothetical protein